MVLCAGVSLSFAVRIACKVWAFAESWEDLGTTDMTIERLQINICVCIYIYILYERLRIRDGFQFLFPPYLNNSVVDT